jgi:hypothetical protein
MSRVRSRTGLAALAREALRSGSIAAVAMIPFGLLFSALGLRVNEYGPRVIRAAFGDLPRAPQLALLLAQHFLIAWLASIPLLVSLLSLRGRAARLAAGAAYGAGFYVAVNSLALPWLFGMPTPWELGVATVAPSLAVHLVYGVSLAVTARPRAP